MAFLPGQPMFMGIALLLIGLVLTLLVWGLLRLLPRLHPARLDRTASPRQADLPGGLLVHAHAILLVQSGGRLEYLNGAARGMFDLREAEFPSLEWLARRIRPGEDFYKLCASEGQARLSINGRPFQAVSYMLPGQSVGHLITLSAPGSTSALVDGGVDHTNSTLQVLTSFSQGLSIDLGLKATIQAILQNVEQLLPADTVTICLWNPAEKTLQPYSFSATTGTESKLDYGKPHLLDPLSSRLIQENQGLLIADSGLSPQPGLPTGIRSYIGVPLLSAGELVGTLEIGLRSSQTYTEADLEMVHLIAGQAAVAIHNAAMLEEEQRRSTELGGLANLAQTIGSARVLKDLFTGLVQSLAPLFDAEIIGFLIYNENRHSLEGQVPFIGMPAQFIGLYQVPIPPGSPVEEILLKPDILVTRNAMEDETWKKLGLQDLARAASVRDSALIPLVSGGRSLGYLQISNHRNPELAFGSDEMRLFSIVANQAAPIIDNATLVQQARQRAQRSEALRRIASLAGSSATLDEILLFAVQELARLLQADAAVIYLLDEPQAVLRMHLDSLWGVKKEDMGSIAHLYIDDPQFHFTVTGSRRSFTSTHLSTDKRVLPLYKPIIDNLKVESAIVVPLVVRERGIGELMIASREKDFFNTHDLQLVATAAGQLAAAIDGSSLASRTDEGLRLKVDQLMTLTRLNREMNTARDVKHILQVVYDECLRLLPSTRAGCGRVLLFKESSDPTSKTEVIAYMGDELGDDLLPIELDAILNGAPLVVPDFSQSTYLAQHAGDACELSALVLPISYEDKVFGLIHLHSSIASHFEDTTVESMQTLAVQAAIALGNFQRYQVQERQNEDLRLRADTMSRLFETARLQETEQSLDKSLDALALGLQEATPFDIVLISVIDTETGLQRRVAAAGIPAATLEQLKLRQQPWSGVQQLLLPEFKLGSGYFIPHDQRPLTSTDVQLVTILPAEQMDLSNAWHPEDAFLFPLFDENQNPIGLISLDAPRNGLRPTSGKLGSLEMFAAQAALIIQSTYRLSSYKTQVETLSISLKRQEQLFSSSQNHLPILLHKDLEQMISIRKLERRARRIRASLEITEVINRQVDSQSALLALGSEILTRLEMSTSIVAENSAEGPRLLHVLGNIPQGVNPEAMFGQRNPLRQCLQTGEAVLVMNTDEDDTWRESTLLVGLRTRGFICLPILLDGKPVAAILAVSRETLPALTDEDRQVYLQISRQGSIILQNISLLTETRQHLREGNLLLDFSRQLSGLDTVGILKTLLDSAMRVVGSAHAGAVIRWDEAESCLIPLVAMNYANNESLSGIHYRSGEALPGQVFADRKPRRVDEVHFALDYNLPAEHLVRYREATGGRLPVASILIPIQTSKQIFGVLVMDNFNSTGAFSQEDENLLLSLTQQVALSLENSRLVQGAQERAAQLQALTNASGMLTASLKTGDLVAILLDQLKVVLPYDTAILWMRDHEQLSVAAVRGFPDNEQRIGIRVAVEDSALLAEMVHTSRLLVVADVRLDRRFPGLVAAERFSWMGIPLISNNQVTGVIALEKTEPNYYSPEHVQLVTTFASQAAVALDNASLYEDSLRRAAELDQRSQRLAQLNHLSSVLGGSLSEEQILGLTSEELLSALAGKKVSVVTFDRFGDAHLQVSIPEDKKHKPTLPAKAPLFDRLGESLGVFSTEAVDRESELEPFKDFLLGTRSLLILPLAGNSILRALMFVQMAEEHHFSSVEIDLARTICNQAGIALESARLYHTTLTRADQLATINRASHEIGISLDPEEIYLAIHKATSQLMPAESFVIALMNEVEQLIDGVYLVDPSGRGPAQTLALGEGLTGRVIATGQPLLIPDVDQVEALGGKTYGEGQPRSIVAVPIIMSGKVMGMLSAQSHQANIYGEDELQILGTMANQAAVSIQNGRLFAETRRLAQELEQRVVERTGELENEKRNTETLLRILTEVTASLDLDRALNRTLVLLNEAIGADQGTVLLLDPGNNSLQYRAGYGYLAPLGKESRKEGKPASLGQGEGLAGWVINHRQTVLVGDVTRDERWIQLPLKTPTHHSAIVAPLTVGEEAIGVLMVFHTRENYFTPEQMNLVQAVAGQVAVAINNTQLYELIRDQAERLGGMLRKEQVEASRQQAILEAVADGVLVTDPANQITFINLSARRILNLDPGMVLDHPLDDFIGLFGKAAQTWMKTIHTWSQDPGSFEQGETYAEQLTLETGRVVLVHLAPVIWRKEFLGSVSIFRDITHEVEVDRLKSEFVATVSHELRTPMTSIKGYVDVLLMGAAGALNENQVHFLEIVRSNTERLNILVNDLLDVSRIESGRVALSLQPLDLREIADDVMADVIRRSQEENKPMEFSMDAAPDLPRVVGDMERVSQILTIMVENAYHYTHANGQVSISLQPVDSQVQIDVKDNGIGIPAGDQERIFDRFYRGEDPLVLATPGTGLGLAIVRQLVKMHKGRIWVKSSGVEGEGCTFSFTLPVYQSDDSLGFSVKD
jgi:GAF domain-containing protein/nitrogen-specific signal transduction histidine kinase